MALPIGYKKETDDKVMVLAEKMWDALNEVDYDPMHPRFSEFDDKVKEKVIGYAKEMLAGFPSINEDN